MRREAWPLLVLLCQWPLPSGAVTWFDLQPFRFDNTGFVGLSASISEFEDINDERIGMIARDRFQVASQGYLYRPWVLSLNLLGTLDANLNRYDLYEGETRNEISAALDSQWVLFPEQKGETKLNLNLGLTNSNGSEDRRYGHLRAKVSKDIKTENTLFSSRYELRHEEEASIDRAFNAHLLDLTYNGSFLNSSNSALLSLVSQQATTDSLDNGELRLLGSFQQQFRFAEQDYTQFLASYSLVDQSSGTLSDLFEHGRLSNLTHWELEDNLSVELFTQAYRSSQELEEGEWPESKPTRHEQWLVSANVNLDYRASDQLDLFATLYGERHQERHHRTELVSVDGFQSQQSLGARWRDYLDLGTFRYSLFGSAVLLTRQGTYESAKIDWDISHSLRRSWPLGKGELSLALAENLFGVTTFKGESSPTLVGHHLDATWLQTDGLRQLDLYARLTDERELADDRRWYQRLDTGLSGSLQLSSHQALGGNLQFSWDKSRERSRESASTGSGYGRLWYRNDRLSGVRHLRLVSTLMIPFDDLFFDDGDKRNDVASFENTLSYNIGRLESELTAVLSEGNQYYSLNLKRHF
ncbi:hypothetical protein FCL40_13125 [Ferrimonas sediminicola]|uniref:Uncharacterized protein n=1 Tax=Ferrimonas sediminicola TaxID=2569538 RepID=A0A4U1BC89_9GAMM|nr:hypothetical protein [Ferrimonas sediminicola]TKB48286.1 hypothetical protein FCL40_13125 [Ferrimonas sediminicola]